MLIVCTWHIELVWEVELVGISRSSLFSMTGVVIIKIIKRINARSSNGVILSSLKTESRRFEETLLTIIVVSYCGLHSNVRSLQKDQSQNVRTA